MTIRIQKRTDTTDPGTVKRFYELWREWLLETKEAEWEEGDHTEEYRLILSMPFEEWWAKNSRRVADIGYKEYAFVSINSVDDYNDRSYEPIFSIGFDTPKHILHEELDKLIDKYHTNYPPGDKSMYLGGIRSVFWTKRPIKRTVDALELILKVHRAAKKLDSANPETMLIEIGLEAELRQEYRYRLEPTYNSEDGKNESELIAITTSRYIRWANHIIYFLNKGEFPNYNSK